MTAGTHRILVPAFAALVSLAAAGPAAAAPPWLDGLGNYRIVDASGRVEYRPDGAASGRIAYRPPSAPSFLLRARPFYLSGYAGAVYGRGAGRPAPVPTGYYAGEGRKPCGHAGACRHGR